MVVYIPSSANEKNRIRYASLVERKGAKAKRTMYSVISSHRARDHPREGRSGSVDQSLRRTSYPPTSFFREVFPVPYQTDEGGAEEEEEEEARRIRTSRVWLACVRRAFTTSVSDGSG